MIFFSFSLFEMLIKKHDKIVVYLQSSETEDGAEGDAEHDDMVSSVIGSGTF